MIYQVTANLYFDEEDEANDFFHDCELAFAKSTSINPDGENSEWGVIQLIENNHDQNPNDPCNLLSSINNNPNI